MFLLDEPFLDPFCGAGTTTLECRIALQPPSGWNKRLLGAAGGRCAALPLSRDWTKEAIILFGG